jgi:hypothetical protein
MREDGKGEMDARADEKGMRDGGRGTMGEGQWKREVWFRCKTADWQPPNLSSCPRGGTKYIR